jgi:hypothetical protein
MRLRLTALLLLVALVARPASAHTARPSTKPTTITRVWNACGGPGPTSLMCASVKVAVTGTTTVLSVRNLSGDPTLNNDGFATSAQWILTTVGFDGVTAAAGTFTKANGLTISPWWVHSLSSIIPPGQWQRYDDKQFGPNGVNVDFGMDNGPGLSGGIASACATSGMLPVGSTRIWMTPVDGCNKHFILGEPLTDGWFVTSFTTVSTWDPRNDDVSVYFRGQTIGGGSYECLFGGAHPAGNCSDAQFVDDVGDPGALDPMSPVPEPRTFLLVGTGAVALLAVRYRRRRLP